MWSKSTRCGGEHILEVTMELNFQCCRKIIPYLYVGTWRKAHVDVMERYLKPVAYFGALSIVLQNFIAQLGGAFIRYPNTTLE